MKTDPRTTIGIFLLLYAVVGAAVVWLINLLLPGVSLKLSVTLLLGGLPLVTYLLVRATTTGKTVEAAAIHNDHFRIGEARLVVASRELRFGQTVEDMQPKVFDLLVFMVAHRERVVSKEELLDALWPGVVVSEASLTQTIKRLRDAFRNNGFTTDIIRTVPRKGYQFDHDVEKVSATPARTSATQPQTLYPTSVAALIACLLMVVVWFIEPPEENQNNAPNRLESLVVLPFEDLTGQADFDYFTLGLTETITYTLTRAEELTVIAFSSAQKLGGENQTPQALGQRLGVTHVVTGSVQKQDDALRIRASLIDTQTSEQIWSGQFDKTLDNVFALHDEIAKELLAHSRIALNSAPTEEQTGEEQEESQIYLWTLQADNLRRQGSKNAVEQARNLYRKTLEIAPNYSKALVGLADVYRRQTTLGMIPRETGFDEAIRLATKATKSDPSNAEALVQIAEIQHRHFWDFASAEQSFLKAIEMRPSYSPAQVAYGRFLSKAGRYEQALQRARAAKTLDPLSASATDSLAIRLIRADALEEARQVLDDMQQTHADNPNLPWLEANWHIRAKQFQKALPFIAREEYAYLRLSMNAIALHHLGRTGQAQKALDELIRTDAEGAAFQIAEVYAQWSNPDKAFAWLQRAFEQGDPGIIELYSSVNLSNLYGDPRFFALARQIGLPDIEASALLAPQLTD